MVRPWEICQAIYIHIPFCRHKCCYCDFTSYQGQSETVQERYTEALCREIRTCRPGLPVSPRATVYFGGGTPTCLSLSCLTRIVAALKDAGFWQQPAEATVEANPGTLSPDFLQALRRLGFDRLSLGVQSLQADELQRMGRIHTAEEARQAFLEARDAGFRRISTDLIYGYPGQTAASVEDTLQRLLAWQPDHVSVYGLSVEPGTVLAARLDQGVWQLPDEEESILLDRHSPALHLIQRVRDESHRFAITFHRQLRGKRNLVSILDHVVGIGPKRRQALRQHFGTLAKMQAASVEELAAAPGMTRPAAEAVYDFFLSQKAIRAGKKAQN